MTRALVLGGTGAIGRHVVRGLAAEGVAIDFTWHRSAEVASELPGEGHQVDLADIDTVRAWVDTVPTPRIVVHCAADPGPDELSAVTPSDWARIQAVNCEAPFFVCQALAPRMQDGNIVLVGALGRDQSLPLPVAFAASQGMLGAMAMAMAKELGPRGIRVNLVTAGLLDEGISQAIPDRLRSSFLTYSALRRMGRPEEVARGIVWLALKNTYMSGRALPIHGGI